MYQSGLCTQRLREALYLPRCLAKQETLVEAEFIKHIRRVVCATLATGVNLTRIIPLHTTLLVPPKGIACQIRVLILEVLLGAVRLFGSLRL